MPKAAPAFRSILVPLDGSPLAEQALALGADLARRSGARLRLALVHRPPGPRLGGYASRELASRKAERDYLRGIQAKVRGAEGRPASAVTLSGEAGPALAAHARTVGVDLVIMATHGRGGLQRAWLGSVADFLIRALDVPILLLRPTEEGVVNAPAADEASVLVPLDGSPLAEEALEPAARLARLWDAELTLMQVVWPVVSSPDMALPVAQAYDRDLTEAERAQAQDYLDGVVERLRAEGIPASRAAVVGWSAASTILDATRGRKNGVVALATHGRGGLRRLVLGSVADKVVRGAAGPVLVYRPAGRSKAKASPGRRAGRRKAASA